MNSPAACTIGLLLGTALGFLLGRWNEQKIPQGPLAQEVGPTAPSYTASGESSGASSTSHQPPPPVEAKSAKPLFEHVEPAATFPPDAIHIDSVAEALRLVASGSREDQESAILWLQDRMFHATPAEFAELDARLAAVLATLSVDDRGSALNTLFRPFLSDGTGVQLCEGRLRRLLFETIATLPPGAGHRALVLTLAEQLENEKGAGINHLQDVLYATVQQESYRLDGASVPLGEEGSAALAREMARLAPDADERQLGVLAFGGSTAGEADRRELTRLALETPAGRPRFLALLSMTSVGPSPDLDQVCAHIASDPNRPLGERLLAWQRLKKQGTENLLPVATRREILQVWQASGKASIIDLIDE